MQCQEGRFIANMIFPFQNSEAALYELQGWRFCGAIKLFLAPFEIDYFLDWGRDVTPLTSPRYFRPRINPLRGPGMHTKAAYLSQYKRQLLKIIRPPKKFCDIEGVRYLTKLRLRFSLLNEQKFRHGFDSLTPLCACGMDKEDNEHFFLHCPQCH